MKKINKSKRIEFRVSPTEKKRINGFALKSGLELSDYLRWLSLQGLVVGKVMRKRPGRGRVESYDIGGGDIEYIETQHEQDEEQPPRQEKAG